MAVPGTFTADFHAEAGFGSDAVLCVETFGAVPRGSMQTDRRDGPVPFFQATGFPKTESDLVFTMDWLAVGAVGPEVEAIRFVPDGGGSVQWIREVVALDGLTLFGLSFTTAGRVEILRDGSVIETEILPEPTLRQTISTVLPEPTGPPCADDSAWEWPTDVPVQQALEGDSATSAHDNQSAMGRHFRCLWLTTADAGPVELWTGPIQLGVYTSVSTYESNGSRFLIVLMVGIVARLDVTVGENEVVTYEADDLGRDEGGYASLVARIPTSGDISLRAYEETGALIDVPAPPLTALTVVEGA